MTGHHGLLCADIYGYHCGYTRHIPITVWISKQRSYTDKFLKSPKRYPGYPWTSMIIHEYPRYPDISTGSKFPDNDSDGSDSDSDIQAVPNDGAAGSQPEAQTAASQG